MPTKGTKNDDSAPVDGGRRRSLIGMAYSRLMDEKEPSSHKLLIPTTAPNSKKDDYHGLFDDINPFKFAKKPVSITGSDSSGPHSAARPIVVEAPVVVPEIPPQNDLGSAESMKTSRVLASPTPSNPSSLGVREDESPTISYRRNSMSDTYNCTPIIESEWLPHSKIPTRRKSFHDAYAAVGEPPFPVPFPDTLEYVYQDIQSRVMVSPPSTNEEDSEALKSMLRKLNLALGERNKELAILKQKLGACQTNSTKLKEMLQIVLNDSRKVETSARWVSCFRRLFCLPI